MKLRSLRLHGFKSFADRTTLDFREGVTAVIGSNGCGKSNIADAIRWVLGEQRASAIRGAKMEEVIFQGTARRRPLHFAEVSLHFDNDRGRVPVPQTEIEVSRKVFREGGSEYALNRNACRLRDIHNLLRDTGLGSNAYAVIGAAMIETLLSDRAEERRALFEEAAGIGKYKDSRQAALRRLEASEVDLSRLQDLLAEVESKVRSLARQRRRAERHRELQARRLDLEIAIARAELGTLLEELHAAEARRVELDREERQSAAERAAGEVLTEERRIEAGRLAQERTVAAARLDRVRAELAEREREALLADERRAHAELRIAQLVRERAEADARRQALLAEGAGLAADRVRLSGRLEAVRDRREARGEENLAVRAALAAHRADAEAAALRARELAREIAGREGERASAERRRQEAIERLRELAEREARLGTELGQLAEQAELWEAQATGARARAGAAAEAGELVEEEIRVLRAGELAVRETLRSAEDLLSRLTAQVEAREALERSYEGFSPAVAALMSARDRFPGVHGPLADFVGAGDGPAHGPEAVEGYLGPLLQAVVVDDLATARALRRWFRQEWTGGGSLLLLPLRRGDGPGAEPRTGPGWVAALLADLVVVSGDALEEYRPGVSRLGPDGDLIDARGVVRLPEPNAGEGILARRKALARLREERDRAGRDFERAREERSSVREALELAQERAREAEELRRAADAEARRIEMDTTAHRQRGARLRQERDAARAARAAAEEAGRAAEAGIEALAAGLARLAGEVEEANGRDAALRGRLVELEVRWEQARDEESELRVAEARAESDLREADHRLAAAEQGVAGAAARMGAIDREAAELRATLEGLSGVRERSGAEIERLFHARDQEAASLALVDARLAEVDSELAELGERVRIARRRESAAAEERHRVDLRVAELRSRSERVRERLEVEWARPFDQLLESAAAPADGTLEQWRQELARAAAELASIGPVNMLAVEEHAEEERRLDFLREQRDDLVGARDDLVAAIRQINRTAREVFLQTFETVRENFRRTFQSLFQGGECDLWLADPSDPLESPIEIQASPKGKRTQRIHLLSGGERTLTALALLFGLYLVKPSPFCLFDEIDAPLDESNVGRFLQLLHDFKRETQFIVITHNPRTMEAADWVYGVTMEEPGVSAIVGVELLGTWTLEDRVA